FDGSAGDRVRSQSLAGDHRTRGLRRESLRVVSTFKGRRLTEFSQYQHHRCNRRASNRNSIGSLILILLKSGCFGFNKKFISLALSTLGSARATCFPARTQSSPICIVSKVGGSAFQCGGRLLTGKCSVSLSSHSSRNERYRAFGESGVKWTSNSRAASDSCSLT